MIASLVRTEVRKQRRLHVGLLGVAMVVGIVGVTLVSAIATPDLDPRSADAWLALLAGLSMGVPLVSPLLIAVLASRQVELEHVGQGWMLHAASGIGPGALCRAKLVVGGAIVVAATLAASGLVLVLGVVLVGIAPPPPLAAWMGYTACILVVQLVVLTVQLLLSTLVEQQLIPLGVGVLGTVLALFSQGLPAVAAHLTPWGYYALAVAADYRDGVLVALPLPYPSIVALALIAALLLALAIRHLDRKEI